jgi:hypothetical protein
MNPPTATRRAHLPRLGAEQYRDTAVVHWTMTIDRRGIGWLDQRFHERFRVVLLHTLARHHLACPVYCLMPDHLHMIWMGLGATSDQRLASGFFRRHVNRALDPWELQLQGYDHVLRARERRGDALAALAKYLLLNPVRANLCVNWSDYPYSNTLIAGYPELDVRQPGFWELFLKIYDRLTKPI